MGYSSWGRKELDMTEWLSTHSTAGSLTFFLVVEKNAQPTLNHFKVYSSVVLSIFMLLGNQAPELSHLVKYSRIFWLRAPDPIYLPIKWAHF